MTITMAVSQLMRLRSPVASIRYHPFAAFNPCRGCGSESRGEGHATVACKIATAGRRHCKTSVSPGKSQLGLRPCCPIALYKKRVGAGEWWGEKVRLSRRTHQRSGRRLPRHQGGRSLPSTRRYGFGADAGMDRGRERTDLRLPGTDSGTGKNSRTVERAAELRALLRAGKAGHAVLLLAQQRIAEPKRAVLAALTGCGAKSIAGPEHTFFRRHGGGQRGSPQRSEEHTS